jgi:hypothetical protein
MVMSGGGRRQVSPTLRRISKVIRHTVSGSTAVTVAVRETGPADFVARAANDSFPEGQVTSTSSGLASKIKRVVSHKLSGQSQ